MRNEIPFKISVIFCWLKNTINCSETTLKLYPSKSIKNDVGRFKQRTLLWMNFSISIMNSWGVVSWIVDTLKEKQKQFIFISNCEYQVYQNKWFQLETKWQCYQLNFSLLKNPMIFCWIKWNKWNFNFSSVFSYFVPACIPKVIFSKNQSNQ